MSWKFSAFITFVTVVVAEFITMVVFDAQTALDVNSQSAAILDGLLLGASVFVLQIAGRRFVLSRGQRLKWSDAMSAMVLMVATAEFEIVFHPLSENLGALDIGFGADVVDALLTAILASVLAGWIQGAEDQVEKMASESIAVVSNIGSWVLLGAIVSASCLMVVAAVREANQDFATNSSLLASHLSSQLARQRTLGDRLGRAVISEAPTMIALNVVPRALAAASAIGSGFVREYDQYVHLNRGYTEHLQSMPSSHAVERTWRRLVASSQAFAHADPGDRARIARSVQDAIDEFDPVLDKSVSSIDTLENFKFRLQQSITGDIVSSVMIFLMAFGLLWPLLRLTRAQRSKLALELQRVEKLNDKLSAYQRALDNHAIFAVANRMGKITHVNENFCRISGYLPEELLGQNHRLLNSGMHSAEFFGELWRSISAGKTWRYEVCNRSKSGSLYWVDTCVMPLTGADGAPDQFVSISYDITERKRTEIRSKRKVHLESLVDDMRQELFASGAMYSSMSGLLKELNTITGADASLVCEVGRTVEGMAWSLVLGHFRSREVGTSQDAPAAVRLRSAETQPTLIQDVFQQDGLFGGLSAKQLGAGGFTGIPINIGYEPVGVLLISEGVCTEHFTDEIQLVVAALGDMISARRESDRRRNEEEKARKQAKRDPLTGLGNRRDLAEQFDARIDHPDAKFSLLLVDLDRFKPVNDTYGHLVGDTVLRVVAERLRACARGDVTVARIGGDEFAILTEAHSREDEAGALDLARTILEELTAPIDCGGHKIQVGASVGVALYPRDGTVFQELLHRADAAMYRAKGNRSEAQVFNASMDEAIRFRGELEADLKRAIDAEEVKPYFQPYVDLRTGKVAGHEVLARWRHPQRGFVSPTDFIKIAEESGLVDKLFWQFLRAACELHLRHKLTTVLSINLSPTQIKNPTFAKQLVEELERLGFPPHLLEVEITETSMIGDVDRAKPLLLLLRSQGIRIALDDFGTGYSSLALLRHMPISKVKIDRSFISDVESAEGTGVTIVNAILGMAKALKLQVTAEGIETVEVSDFLRDMGCEYGQGYLFGRAEPEPVADSVQADNVLRLSRVAGNRA